MDFTLELCVFHWLWNAWSCRFNIKILSTILVNQMNDNWWMCPNEIEKKKRRKFSVLFFCGGRKGNMLPLVLLKKKQEETIVKWMKNKLNFRCEACKEKCSIFHFRVGDKNRKCDKNYRNTSQRIDVPFVSDD